jgi:hypothetical protein
MLSSTAFGVVVELDITPQYVSKHKEEFKVETVMRGGNIEFKFTRIAKKRHYWVGRIVIRKDNKTVLKCQLRPSDEKNRVKNHVCYSFTVSKVFLTDSDFLLSEYGLSKSDQFGIPEVGGTVYRFRLQDYVGNSNVAE